MKTINNSVLETLAEYDSATVQNAGIVVRGYINADIHYTDSRLKPMVSKHSKPSVGYALTSTWTPITGSESDGYARTDYFDSIAKANVPVIVVQEDVDNIRNRGAIIGDGMAYQMVALGAIGALVEGNARDIPGIKSAGLPLWATGRVPGHGPFNMIEHEIPVKVASLKISPGDILVCDGDGVTRVAVNEAQDVAKMCAEVRRKETALHQFFSLPNFTADNWEEWKRKQ